MFKKNDPLVGAVQEVMKRNQFEREAARLVNEKFGVTDRKALPHERQGEWDAAYKTVLTEGTEALAALAPPRNKVTKKDVLVGRGVLKKHPSQSDKHVLAKEESDVTSPSSMGIKKPDYASGTPAYANKGPQMVNRAAKTSLPAGTVAKSIKEENLEEMMIRVQMDHDADHSRLEKKHNVRVVKPEDPKAKHIVHGSKENLRNFANNVYDNVSPRNIHPELFKDEKLEEEMTDAQKKAAKLKFILKRRMGKEGSESVSQSRRQDLEEKAVSKAQHRLMGAAYAVKKGGKPISPEVAKVAASMTKAELKKYAGTKEKGLPEKVDEGFNNRHGLSVTASAGKQAVADQLLERVGNPLLLRNRAKARSRLGDAGVRRPISGTNNLQTRLANMRKNAPALDTTRDVSLDRPTTQSNMAIAQNRTALAQSTKDLRAGTNTFVAGARAEAKRRRMAGEPVLKAADVPGINRSEKAIQSAQQQSDEIMAASRAQNRNTLAQTTKDLRAGTNTFDPKTKIDARAQGARVGTSTLAKPSGDTAQPYGMNVPKKLDPDSRIAKGNVAPTAPIPKEKPAAPTSISNTTTASAPATAPAKTPAPRPAAAPPAVKKETEFTRMMRRSQSKSDVAGTPGRRY